MNVFAIILIAGLYLFTYANRRKTMKEIDELATEVREVSTAIDSAITLIQGLKTRLDEALGSGDVAQAVRNLRDDLNRKEQELAAAVVANTPAEGGESGDGGTGEPGTGGGGTEPGTDPGAGAGGNTSRRT